MEVEIKDEIICTLTPKNWMDLNREGKKRIRLSNDGKCYVYKEESAGFPQRSRAKSRPEKMQIIGLMGT